MDENQDSSCFARLIFRRRNRRLEPADTDITSGVLRNPGFKNYVKAILILHETTRAVSKYAEWIFTAFKMSLPDNGKHFDNPDVVQKICKHVQLKKGKWHYRIKHCDKCENLFQSVIGLSIDSNAVCFKNCANQTEPGAWCFAKLFMPKHCENVNRPENVDPYALFRMILNCLRFQTKINGTELSMESVEKILDTRNKIMHSSTLTMTDSELNAFYSESLSFLNETIESVPDDNELKTTLHTALHIIMEIRDLELTTATLPAHAAESIRYQLSQIQVDQQRNNDDKTIDIHQLRRILRAIEVLFGNNNAVMSRPDNVPTEENRRHSCHYEVKYKCLSLAVGAAEERERRASQENLETYCDFNNVRHVLPKEADGSDIQTWTHL